MLNVGEGSRGFAPVARALGDQLVRLAEPSASPPPGTIGLWERVEGGDDLAIVVLSADGERLFVSIIDGVFSTNAMALLGGGTPSLFP